VPVFAVTFGTGPGWDPARSRREQPQWDAHAAFMDSLVADGSVLLGGPIGDGSRVLLAIEAADEAAARARLVDGDPWTPLGILTVERVERWQLWLDGRGGSARG
jgi:uncharacterized protein YciI